ncbi:MAG: dNTP triphosphohydrolase [Acidobacteriaceae bacterium]|nr:dNTP triphosphohydrolase [Acidobacteriaceae bacterium]
MLGRLRLRPEHLRGRKYPEPPHPYRNDFQRDRDRIIHSRAFRRLEGKTQVWAAGLCDHFRNRLTHTIEVSQVARTVAVALGLDEEYTETLALAHDLGHPPFAHVAEKELNRQMARFGDSFEHNRHALRIVEVLEQRYARFHGLNLTFEVREGIVKHSREINGSEEPELRALLPEYRPPLEAQLLDLADEIAYNTADIEDALVANLFTTDEIGEMIPFFAALTEQVDTQFPGASDRVRFWEVQRQLMSVLVGGLVRGTLEAAQEAAVETAEDVRKLETRLARMTPEAADINRQLRNVLVTRVYSYTQLVEERSAAVIKVGELFEYLMENPERVSAGYRENLAEMPVHRVICDYIAGMTDTFFMRVHRELLG